MQTMKSGRKTEKLSHAYVACLRHRDGRVRARQIQGQQISHKQHSRGTGLGRSLAAAPAPVAAFAPAPAPPPASHSAPPPAAGEVQPPSAYGEVPPPSAYGSEVPPRPGVPASAPAVQSNRHNGRGRRDSVKLIPQMPFLTAVCLVNFDRNMSGLGS